MLDAMREHQERYIAAVEKAKKELALINHCITVLAVVRPENLEKAGAELKHCFAFGAHADMSIHINVDTREQAIEVCHLFTQHYNLAPLYKREHYIYPVQLHAKRNPGVEIPEHLLRAPFFWVVDLGMLGPTCTLRFYLEIPLVSNLEHNLLNVHIKIRKDPVLEEAEKHMARIRDGNSYNEYLLRKKYPEGEIVSYSGPTKTRNVFFGLGTKLETALAYTPEE